MTTSTKTSQNDTHTEVGSFGANIPFDSINEPGAYVCNWSGHLLRVPQDGIAPGRSPMLNLIGSEPLFVTKVSTDPYVPITKARLLASNCDVQVNF